MKKLVATLMILTSAHAFSASFSKSQTVNGDIEVFIKAGSSRELQAKCDMLRAHIYRGFVALGQEKMEAETRILDRETIVNKANEVMEVSGVCTLEFSESDWAIRHDASMSIKNGKAIFHTVPKLVK